MEATKKNRMGFYASDREVQLIRELARIQEKNVSEAIRDAVKEAAQKRGLSIAEPNNKEPARHDRQPR